MTINSPMTAAAARAIPAIIMISLIVLSSRKGGFSWLESLSASCRQVSIVTTRSSRVRKFSSSRFERASSINVLQEFSFVIFVGFVVFPRKEEVCSLSVFS